MLSTAVWPGYLGTWTIKNNKFYLTKLDGLEGEIPEKKYLRVISIAFLLNGILKLFAFRKATREKLLTQRSMALFLRKNDTLQ